MRVVVFTADARLEEGPWWPAVLGAAGVAAVLVVRRTLPYDARAVVRRLRRNVRRHGLIFIPYRGAVAVTDLVGRLAHPRSRRREAPSVPVETIEANDIHHPDIVARVAAWAPDLGISLGAPILRPCLFQLPRHGTLNIHLGRVPDFRGAPPGFWELWYGASEVGATVHWVDEGLDTGPVIASAAAPIYPHDTLARVEARARELGLRLLGEALWRVHRGDVQGVPQAGDGRTNRLPTVGRQIALRHRLWWRRVRAKLANPRVVAKYCAAAVWLAIIEPARDFVRTVCGRHPVRVFAFHRVTELCRDGMTVTPATFRRQVAYVRRHHDVVDLAHALDVLATRGRLYRPLAVITFDDGYGSVAAAARPVLRAAGLTGTCFVCTGLVESDLPFGHDAESPVARYLDRMGWDDLRALAAEGWPMGGHTVSHARLSTLAGDALRQEVGNPLGVLRERLGVRDAAMAYPFGGPRDITADGAAAVRAAGYVALFSDHGGENFRGDDLFALKRIDLGGDHDTLMWKVAARGCDLRGWGPRFGLKVRA